MGRNMAASVVLLLLPAAVYGLTVSSPSDPKHLGAPMNPVTELLASATEFADARSAQSPQMQQQVGEQTADGGAFASATSDTVAVSEQKARLTRYRNKLRQELERKRHRASVGMHIDPTKLKYSMFDLKNSMALMVGLSLNIALQFCLLKYAVFL
eukprot:TRINITY_DN104422_c0_g1_i1.p1 TRINITY_DN104422_c0_g1~~TRINITY_DN104422_c0_g1_i1.p1  ORF type:complete len:168 (-),score=28.81 TRINITY_DN104422_c0_g1_i1:13-477(-)